jgi:hypothetical protein
MVTMHNAVRTMHGPSVLCFGNFGHSIAEWLGKIHPTSLDRARATFDAAR